MWGSGDKCGIRTGDRSRGCSGDLLRDAISFCISCRDALAECQGRCGISSLYDTTPVRSLWPIEGTVSDVVSADRERRYRGYLRPSFSKASSLNKWCASYHLPSCLDLIKVPTMQTPVPECNESEDDEVDNDPPLTASRSDSETVSSWDVATCGECIVVLLVPKRGLEVSILSLTNFGEYLCEYVKTRAFPHLR